MPIQNSMGAHNFTNDLVLRRFNIKSKSQAVWDPSQRLMVPRAANFERDPAGVSGYSSALYYGYHGRTDNEELKKKMVDLSYHHDESFTQNVFCVYIIPVNEAEALSPLKFISFEEKIATDGHPDIRHAHVNMFFGKNHNFTRRETSKEFETWRSALMSKIILISEINQPKEPPTYNN